MLWVPVLGAILLWLPSNGGALRTQTRGHGNKSYQISPKPCMVNNLEGTCMFVWECIKSEGEHLGMCVDSFMFGSCCSHNQTSNSIPDSETDKHQHPSHHNQGPAILYSPPDKAGQQQQQQRPQRPHSGGYRPDNQNTRPQQHTVSKRPGHEISRPSFETSRPNFENGRPDDKTKPEIGHIGHGVPGYRPNLDIGRPTEISSVNNIKTSSRPHSSSHHEFNLSPSQRPSNQVSDSNSERLGAAHHSMFITSAMSRPLAATVRPITVISASSRPASGSALFPSISYTTSTTQPPRGSASLRPVSTEELETSETWNTRPPSSAGVTVWQVTTEPNFITKPRPYKPLNNDSLKPKPTKKSTTPSLSTQRFKATTTRKPYTTPTKSATSLGPIENNKPYSIHHDNAVHKPGINGTTILSLVPNEGPHKGQGLPDIHSLRPTPTPSTVSSSTDLSNLAAILGHTLSPTSDSMMPTSTLSSVSAHNNRTAKCGVTPLYPRPGKRIVGGKDAPFGKWPWQVSVRRTSFFGFSSTHRCGGAILNDNWIATAGHCVDDLLTSQIRIRVGEYDFSKAQEEYPYVERTVARKIVHPKYNFFTYEYDLALVQLDKPLVFAPHISPICLPASDDLLIGENATVTGWGRLSEGGTLPSVLQEVQVPIVSNDRCKSMFLRAGRHEYIPEIFLCAGHDGGGQDSCQGDSGGPLQVKGRDGRYFLAGIISWGIGCAEANLPGVCTRISKFVPWILENVT